MEFYSVAFLVFEDETMSKFADLFQYFVIAENDAEAMKKARARMNEYFSTEISGNFIRAMVSKEDKRELKELLDKIVPENACSWPETLNA